jgi:hypothetical protein
MTPSDIDRVEQFIARWQNSSGNERANYQMFFSELCDALGVMRPDAKGSIPGNPFCFDKDVKVFSPNGSVNSGFIDFYKADHFVIEAKQGGTQSGKGTAKRGTNSYLKEMEKAFIQAIAYTRTFANKPPFVLTCDIGSHFELWQGFSGEYGGYGARQEISLTELQKPEVFALFVDIFTNPQARNPEKIAAKVTREVAADLAELSKRLEGQHDPQVVAHFLMRCIFTMFAEDVGLLKEHLFTDALATRWLPNPKTFKPEVSALWEAMNDGTAFGFYGRLLKFNGGLFSDSTAFELTTDQLEVLLRAARREWKDVEPAIFGTLLERALDSRERSKLGAHYTPRSYVERLVRPVVMEPLREQWDLVQGEVKQLLGDVETEPTAAKKKKATEALEGFLTELQQVKVLDPACGSGNFLYVTLDLMKQLESEVLRRLEDVTGQGQLRLDITQVNPSQFLGIELNPRAAAIADLVIWIGYLQWHFRRFGDIPPVEPVLREYKNIECRDAVLAWDERVPDVDKEGKVRTRWGGRTMKHPVTGEAVPDPSDQVTIWRYVNARSAEWQEANYVVSNPPFIGNSRMREMLGDGYAETLRKIYRDVPDTVDFVMYWWHKTADLVRKGNINRFGLITTNTITQKQQRQVIDFHTSQEHPINLFFAIPDHPWTEGGADVRIAMTSGCQAVKRSSSYSSIQLGKVFQESDAVTPEDKAEQIKVVMKNVGIIFSNLQSGSDVSSAKPLKSNANLCCPGVKLHGSGFCITQQESANLEPEVIHPYLNGRDLLHTSRNTFVIDLFGLSEKDVFEKYPQIYQWIYERVKPERDQNNRKVYREKWWIFGEPRANFRPALAKLQRYIATVETAKYRTFMFLKQGTLPDNMLIATATEDAYVLGVLSSKIHITWALAAGGTLEDRPRYNKTLCFDPFPFPDRTPTQDQRIRDLGDRLDTHRKRVQEQHPDVTITAMYNLLEKIRTGDPLTDKEREFNSKALVSTLKQIHDDLDTAVFEAYGWSDLTDSTVTIEQREEQILERLVALNAQRAEEERNGLIRWLRPDYQAPNAIQTQQTIIGIAELEEDESAIAPVEQQKLPKAFKDQLATVRDLLRTQGGEWTIDQIAAQFKGASRQKQSILTCLESLEALGIVTSYSEDGTIRWYLAEFQKVA